MRIIQSTSLLNEYKGYLFEFLVAQNCARESNIEVEFLSSIPEGFIKMLKQQEDFIREFYPHLLVDLPILASSLSKNILKYINKKVIKVKIIGKYASSLDKKSEEADIILYCSDKKYPISLKISKNTSFVNTKSAGVKSFIGKYFYQCDNSQDYQRHFSGDFDLIYNKFTRSIHEVYNIDYTDDFHSWMEGDLPHLPGELNNEGRKIYTSMISELSQKLFFYLEKLYKENPIEFLESLPPLCGFSSNNLIQAICFYKIKDGHYELKFEKLSSFDQRINQCLLSKNSSSGSLSIKINECSLQIRVKAMNKFTNKGFKVNCAVKYFD